MELRFSTPLSFDYFTPASVSKHTTSSYTFQHRLGACDDSLCLPRPKTCSGEMLFGDTLAGWCSFFKHRRGRGRGCAGRACQLLSARCGGGLLAACSGELCPTYPAVMALALPLCFCAAVYLIYSKDLTLLAYKHRAASGSIWRLPYRAARHRLLLSFFFLAYKCQSYVYM